MSTKMHLAAKGETPVEHKWGTALSHQLMLICLRPWENVPFLQLYFDCLDLTFQDVAYYYVYYV